MNAHGLAMSEAAAGVAAAAHVGQCSTDAATLAATPAGAPACAAGVDSVPPRFDERRLRTALGRFATGVVVISTGSGDSLHAMTANAFMSGSLRPPLIVVSVGQRARMHERLMSAERFGVSVLSDEQEPHSRHFAGEPQSWLAPCFTEVEGLDGVVLLERAVARFGLRMTDRHACGDHTLFVGEVMAFSLDERAPLVFFGGRYAGVALAR